MIRPVGTIKALVKLYNLPSNTEGMTFVDQTPPIVILPPFTRQPGREQIRDQSRLLHELDHVEFGMVTPSHPKEDEHEPT